MVAAASLSLDRSSLISVHVCWAPSLPFLAPALVFASFVASLVSPLAFTIALRSKVSSKLDGKSSEGSSVKEEGEDVDTDTAGDVVEAGEGCMAAMAAIAIHIWRFVGSYDENIVGW